MQSILMALPLALVLDAPEPLQLARVIGVCCTMHAVHQPLLFVGALLQCWVHLRPVQATSRHTLFMLHRAPTTSFWSSRWAKLPNLCAWWMSCLVEQLHVRAWGYGAAQHASPTLNATLQEASD